MTLSDSETRALGALIEKEATTPEYYPLSLNALTLACNQKTNRDPVTSYDEDTVSEALDSLRAKDLARSVAGSRVVKYEHSILEVFNLGRRELALLCALMLRGPQTVGELRDRSERMRSFSDLAEVEACLETLMHWEPAATGRASGASAGHEGAAVSASVGWRGVYRQTRQTPERAASIEEQVESLRQELAQLREEFTKFRSQFEGGD